MYTFSDSTPGSRSRSAGGDPGSIGPAGDMGSGTGRELVLQISEKNKKIISQKYLDTQKYL